MAGLVSILIRINTAIKVFRYNIICIVFALCVCHQPNNELCLALHVATAMPLNNLRVHALRMIKLSGLMLVFTVAGTTFLVSFALSISFSSFCFIQVLFGGSYATVCISLKNFRINYLGLHAMRYTHNRICTFTYTCLSGMNESDGMRSPVDHG